MRFYSPVCGGNKKTAENRFWEENVIDLSIIKITKGNGIE